MRACVGWKRIEIALVLRSSHAKRNEKKLFFSLSAHTYSRASRKFPLVLRRVSVCSYFSFKLMHATVLPLTVPKNREIDDIEIVYEFWHLQWVKEEWLMLSLLSVYQGVYRNVCVCLCVSAHVANNQSKRFEWYALEVSFLSKILIGICCTRRALQETTRKEMIEKNESARFCLFSAETMSILERIVWFDFHNHLYVSKTVTMKPIEYLFLADYDWMLSMSLLRSVC